LGSYTNIVEWRKRAAKTVGQKNIITENSDLIPFSHDEYALDTFNRMPLAVVKPATEEEIQEIVRLCRELKVPVTARGGGTGLSGACVPAEQGIVLSLERLNSVVDADPANHTITVQAGVTLKKLYEEVDKMGLFFPPHPGDEGAFIGGAVATNAGGARAVKYGTIRRFVLGLQVVWADGRLSNLGGKFIKSSSGYNLTDLIIGSEGTLSIITRITLSLLPRPGAISTLVAPFNSVKQAIETVPEILSRGILPTAVEFVQHEVISCAEQLLKKSWPTHDGSASLLFILDGRNEDDLLAQAEKLAELLESGGALDVLIAESPERQEEILSLRSMIYEALREGTVELFDICVPRSEIAGHVEFVKEVEERYKIQLPTYGHAGDGNVHTHYMRKVISNGLLTAEITGWRQLHLKVREELFADAAARGGVISGEHGIGRVRREYLEKNLGTVNVEVMQLIKHALDSENILNPGKVVLWQ